jgi:hypothetical protein
LRKGAEAGMSGQGKHGAKALTDENYKREVMSGMADMTKDRTEVPEAMVVHLPGDSK